MNNSRNLTSEGALYELVSRGNKDAFFYRDNQEALFPFNNQYNPTPPTIHELRALPPLQATEFGRSIDFEFEIAGDVVVEPTLRIQLPSWLPDTVQNGTSLVTDTAGVCYGYISGVAYFLFEKIQFWQDQLLLQEWSGDGLYATTRSRGSLASAFLENSLTGVHDGSSLAIQRNATPPLLRLTLPLVGCQDLADGGFPRVAAVQQKFRIRCVLRKLDALVEASDGRARPQPWGRTDFICQTSEGGLQPDGSYQSATQIPFSTLDRLLMASPTIFLETRHLYTDSVHQEALRTTPLVIPYERIIENNFTQGPLDYASQTPQVKRRLDGNYPVSRAVLTFRSQTALAANRRSCYTVAGSDNQFYTTASLLIAGREREAAWDPLVLSWLEQHAKEERYSGYDGLFFFNWTLGDQLDRRAPFPRQLDGSINFTTAEKPTLLLQLSQAAAAQSGGFTYLDVYMEAWAALEIEGGRSSLLFGN